MRNVPVRARNVHLAPHATVAEALCAITLECVNQIAANAAGLVRDRDPEWVHQMRIGTRRLRSCLALDTVIVPENELGTLVPEVKWLADILGDARDWDVFATETMPLLAAYSAHDAAAVDVVRRLRARVASRRSAARVAARKAVSSRRFRALLLHAGASCRARRVATTTPADFARLDARTEPAKSFAEQLLTRRHRKTKRRLDALAHGTHEERHAVRIAAKKLRYAAEFFAPLFHHKRTRAYVKALSQLQDVLGRFNDAATATRLLQDLDRSRLSSGTDAMREWIATRSASLEPELAKARKRFDKAKRFWR